MHMYHNSPILLLLLFAYRFYKTHLHFCTKNETQTDDARSRRKVSDARRARKEGEAHNARRA